MPGSCLRLCGAVADLLPQLPAIGQALRPPAHSHPPPSPCPARLRACLQEAEGAAAKQRAAAAQSVAGVREALAGKAAEVAQRIERGSKRAGKMPELAQMLMPFLD